MKNGKNIRGALSYNEAKVRNGNAGLILASRFGCEASDLSFTQKLRRFEILNDKCVRSGFNTVHLSLNFHRQDKLDHATLQQISQDYMRQLGFEKQPYLVYRHDDAGHPHLHIVTTPVRKSGTVINLHNLVQRKSEPARKSIELQYELIKAEKRQSEGLRPIDINKQEYDKAETKQAISQIVRYVAEQYRYTSFEEYQLALRSFNIIVDPGEIGTRMYHRGGLQYFICDKNGKPISVPIKASAIYTSPTIKNIEKHFGRNELRKNDSQAFTARSVQFAIRHSKSRRGLVDLLNKRNIEWTINKSGEQVFIDHRNRTVHTATTLGLEGWMFYPEVNDKPIITPMLEMLLQNEYTGIDVDAAFQKKRRKKKR